jgi:hypothetical protein
VVAFAQKTRRRSRVKASHEIIAPHENKEETAMLSSTTLTIHRPIQHPGRFNVLFKAATSLSVMAALSACNTTGRGNSESAPPPMKQIDTSRPVTPIPAPASPPASQAPASQNASPPPVASAPAPVAAQKPVELEPELKPIVVSAGLHRCELGKRVLVKRVASDGSGVQINWNTKDYTLRSVPTQSGAKRFEDSKAGIAWVVISAKAFILDTKRGQMLANECKL